MLGGEMLAKIVNRLSDFTQRHLVMSSNGIQNVRFDKINKREAGAGVIRKFNYGPEEFRPRTGGILSSRNP